MPAKLRILIAIVATLLPLDQISKLIVESRLVHGERVPVIEGFFYITHARNPGAAFGLFAGSASDGRLVVFAVAVGGSLLLGRMLAADVRGRVGELVEQADRLDGNPRVGRLVGSR